MLALLVVSKAQGVWQVVVQEVIACDACVPLGVVAYADVVAIIAPHPYDRCHRVLVLLLCRSGRPPDEVAVVAIAQGVGVHVDALDALPLALALADGPHVMCSVLLTADGLGLLVPCHHIVECIESHLRFL